MALIFVQFSTIIVIISTHEVYIQDLEQVNLMVPCKFSKMRVLMFIIYCNLARYLRETLSLTMQKIAIKNFVNQEFDHRGSLKYSHEV